VPTKPDPEVPASATDEPPDPLTAGADSLHAAATTTMTVTAALAAPRNKRRG
jgi:hypothetical protein